MEFEIDEVGCQGWDWLDEQLAPANHPPEWSRDCIRGQTGVLIPEESAPIELRFASVE